MFNQIIGRIGIRYGVLCGLACFAVVLALYFTGINPFGDMGRLSYLPLPVCIILAIRYYKVFSEGELSFTRGLRVGLSVSFYTALSAAMLVFLLIYVAGPEALQQHIAEMKAVLDATRAEQVELIGEAQFEEGYKALDTITPGMLAAVDFVGRMFAGGLFSVVAAVFFRK